jgi:hypothetical protein
MASTGLAGALPSSCVLGEVRSFVVTGGAPHDSRGEVESLCTGVPTVAGTWLLFALVPVQKSHINNCAFLKKSFIHNNTLNGTKSQELLQFSDVNMPSNTIKTSALNG